MIGSVTSKKMEILKKIWSNFEIDLRPLKFSPKNFRPLTSIYASLLYSEVAAGVFEQYIRPSNVLICIFQKKWKFWKKVGLTLKLIWDPLNFLLKILDPLFCCPKIWDPLKTLRVGIPHYEAHLVPIRLKSKNWIC